MTIDSFGYEVLSLRELRNELDVLIQTQPHLADKPVWVANCPPLFWPIKRVSEGDGRGVKINLERGGR